MGPEDLSMEQLEALARERYRREQIMYDYFGGFNYTGHINWESVHNSLGYKNGMFAIHADEPKVEAPTPSDLKVSASDIDQMLFESLGYVPGIENK